MAQYSTVNGSIGRRKGSSEAMSIMFRIGNRVAEIHVGNMSPLDASVNRSREAQVQQQIKDLPPNTPINSVIIMDR
ncbi:hypothetical protein [Burkholderia sp. Ac-20365]|uniref:hypothetical protein n=1 Tax=Burkholderia sp. Ac-20365 TaxID=2703897 RepID=UPI00197C6D2D|nr:hypothetical protein [Burkholderia sp. Ac-20365]